MKPGDLCSVHKFEDLILHGVYLGPTRRFVSGAPGYLGRFLSCGGELMDFDLGNHLVYHVKVV